MSKKNSTFAPVFVTAYTYTPIFETVKEDKNPNLVHHEALSIREILVRSSRGQRLDLHTRMRAEGIPDDMYPLDQLEHVNEQIHDAPPDGINDIVDVYAYQEELAAQKQALKERAKKKRKTETTGTPAKDADTTQTPAKTDEGTKQSE